MLVGIAEMMAAPPGGGVVDYLTPPPGLGERDVGVSEPVEIGGVPAATIDLRSSATSQMLTFIAAVTTPLRCQKAMNSR